MGILRAIFGPSRKEIWSQIADDIGGEFIEGGFWSQGVLTYQHDEWEIILDTFTTGGGQNNSSTTYIRMRAPFVNKDGLSFQIYRKNIFSFIGKMLGLQDIIIGESFFDDNFIIKGNHVEKIQQLLSYEKMRELIHELPGIHFEIKDDEGFFAKKFPEGVDQLYFASAAVGMKDTASLKVMFQLFAITLELLVQIDSAYDTDPEISLR